MEQPRNIAVLGSTGSIGVQTLDIIEEYPQRFKAWLLTANRQWELLAEQARKFLPSKVIIASEEFYVPLKEALADLPIEVAAGSAAIAEAAGDPEIDLVVTALVGYSGVEPTINAIKADKKIALANKETLVVAGAIINDMLKRHNSEIVPVDSEHSAIFQCLAGESYHEAEKIILTASGGPFRTWDIDRMRLATRRDALKHPRWDMGAKVTIDSASMMNKGFEMIEAHWLFHCPPDKIEIVVHPQSIVHSMVMFCDGSVKAQLGVTDMHLPIRYALGHPERLATSQTPLQLSQYAELTFEAPDYSKFPLLAYAFEAIEKGGNMPCILNAANEIAVAAFLREEIRFMQIPEVARAALDKMDFVASPCYEDLVATNAATRRHAEQTVRKLHS